ncbi:MAG: hypothetical protein GWO02_22215 [Gammaproteobacteria bacterium]|nr:hypothetical protein [Gammaproteobacteria bacterium]
MVRRCLHLLLVLALLGATPVQHALALPASGGGEQAADEAPLSHQAGTCDSAHGHEAEGCGCSVECEGACGQCFHCFAGLPGAVPLAAPDRPFHLSAKTDGAPLLTRRALYRPPRALRG